MFVLYSSTGITYGTLLLFIIFTFILSKLEFGFKSHISMDYLHPLHGLFTPVTRDFSNGRKSLKPVWSDWSDGVQISLLILNDFKRIN